MKKIIFISVICCLLAACSSTKEAVTVNTFNTVECNGARDVYDKAYLMENGNIAAINGIDTFIIAEKGCKIIRSYEDKNDTLFYTDKNGKKKVFGIASRGAKESIKHISSLKNPK